MGGRRGTGRDRESGYITKNMHTSFHVMKVQRIMRIVVTSSYIIIHMRSYSIHNISRKCGEIHMNLLPNFPYS